MTDRRPFTPFRGDERITASEEAADLYRAGHTICCVATLLGRPYATTRELLVVADVTFRPRGSRCTATH